MENLLSIFKNICVTAKYPKKSKDFNIKALKQTQMDKIEQFKKVFVQLSEKEIITFLMEIGEISSETLTVISNSIEFGIFMNWFLENAKRYSSLELAVFDLLYICIPLLGDDWTLLLFLKDELIEMLDGIDKKDYVVYSLEHKIDDEQINRRKLLINYFCWKLDLNIHTFENVFITLIKETAGILKWINKTQRVKIEFKGDKKRKEIIEEKNIIKGEGYDSLITELLQITFKQFRNMVFSESLKENCKLLFNTYIEILKENTKEINELVKEDNILIIKALLCYNNESANDYYSSSIFSSSTFSSSSSFLFPFSILFYIKTIISFINISSNYNDYISYSYLFDILKIYVNLIYLFIYAEEIIGYGSIKEIKEEEEEEKKEEKEKIICRRIILCTLKDNWKIMQDFTLSFKRIIYNFDYFLRQTHYKRIFHNFLSIFIHIVFLPLNLPFSSELYYNYIEKDKVFNKDKKSKQKTKNYYYRDNEHEYSSENHLFLFNYSLRYDLLHYCMKLDDFYKNTIKYTGYYIRRNEENWLVRLNRDYFNNNNNNNNNNNKEKEEDYDESKDNLLQHKKKRRYINKRRELLKKESKYLKNYKFERNGDIFYFVCQILSGEGVSLENIEKERKEKRKKEGKKENKNEKEKKKQRKTLEKDEEVFSALKTFMKYIKYLLFNYSDKNNCNLRNVWIIKRNTDEEYNEVRDIFEEEDGNEIIVLHKFMGKGKPYREEGEEEEDEDYYNNYGDSDYNVHRNDDDYDFDYDSDSSDSNDNENSDGYGEFL